MSSTPPSPNDLTRQQLDELDSLLQRMLSLPLNSGGETTAVPAVTPAPLPEVPPAPSLYSGAWRSDTGGSGKIPYLNQDAPPVPLATTPTAKTGSAWGPDPLARPSSIYPVANESARLLAPPRPEPTPAPTTPTPGTAFQYDLPAGAPTTLRGVDTIPFPRPSAPTPEVEEPPAAPAPVSLVSAPSVTNDTTLAAATAEIPAVPIVLWPLFAINWVLEVILGLFGPLGRVLKYPPIKHVLGVVGMVLLAGAAVWTARGMGWVRFPWPLW